ncbi:hypothetical protein RQP46_008921 [Phenoliferia psychrophenolica]
MTFGPIVADVPDDPEPLPPTKQDLDKALPPPPPVFELQSPDTPRAAPTRGVQLFDGPVPVPASTAAPDRRSVGSQNASLKRKDSAHRVPVPSLPPLPNVATDRTGEFTFVEGFRRSGMSKSYKAGTRTHTPPLSVWSEKHDVKESVDIPWYGDLEDERTEEKRKRNKRIIAWAMGILLLHPDDVRNPRCQLDRYVP